MTQPPQWPGQWGPQPPQQQPPPGSWGPPQQPYPPYPGHLPPPLPPQKSRAWIWGVIAAVCVVGLVAVGVLALVLVHSGALNVTLGGQLSEGQCVTSDDYSAGKLQSSDCSDLDAVYEFAGKTDEGRCPDGKPAAEGSYFVFVPTDGGDQWCFAMNLSEGECYLLDLDESTMTHVACAQANSRAGGPVRALHVTDRIDDGTDTSQCGPVTLSYSQPERAYCFEAIDGN
ncbi:hypothetical protein ACWDTP_12635 [Mycobacterium sp. NPDC003449]